MKRWVVSLRATYTGVTATVAAETMAGAIAAVEHGDFLRGPEVGVAAELFDYVVEGAPLLEESEDDRG